MRRLIERILLSPRGLDAAEWLFSRWPLRDVLDALAARHAEALWAVIDQRMRARTAALKAVLAEAPPPPSDGGTYAPPGSERRRDCA
ncbi:hypothetical protein GXW77_18145 [Roseomonas alkaliterrae]|jgi:hypothetical protein|uniref:hypothetical protein n=1 Tax=Neoroseomonas alkaliterrae TaxID=1452450 RepID=UPI001BAADEF5|nr:hypothetical protein [Neoroseomonas alkaliterrae]MBR0678096.1 hypothetical protein [Neoroseomonas alkaliterrae]